MPVKTVKTANSDGQPLLKDQVYAKIKERIMSGEFPPQSFLSERKLSAAFMVSKTPIRGALERLAHEGFVTISPQQGIFVQGFSLQNIVDLFDTRAALESHVLNAVAGRLSPAQQGKVEAVLAEQKKCATGNDISQSVILDSEFHLLFCDFLGNAEIIRIMRTFRDKVHQVILRVLSRHPPRQTTSYEEHRDIARAVFNGNGPLAAKRLNKHLEYGKQSMISR